MKTESLTSRKSIRLKNYDYTQEAAFFITLVCQGRVKRFGKLVNGEMILNTFGEIAVREWINTVNCDLTYHSVSLSSCPITCT
jgi:hypothetical protein